MNRTIDRYLYAIRTLKEKYLCVRAVDVSHYLGLSKSAVSIAIRQIKERGLIEMEPDGNLVFTAKGKNHVDLLESRIRFFQQLLTDAGVDPAQAMRDAISFSWEMSDASFEAFKAMRPGG